MAHFDHFQGNAHGVHVVHMLRLFNMLGALRQHAFATHVFGTDKLLFEPIKPLNMQHIYETGFQCHAGGHVQLWRRALGMPFMR